MPASSHVHELARAVAPGGTGRASQAVPPADREKVVAAAHYAFVTGSNTIAMVSVVVAAVGCVAGYALVRSRDFVGGLVTAPPEPARAQETAPSPSSSADRHLRRSRVGRLRDPNTVGRARRSW
jgi:hypothetical protein